MDLFESLLKILTSAVQVNTSIAVVVVSILLLIIFIQNRRLIEKVCSRSSTWLAREPPSLDCKLNDLLKEVVIKLEATSAAIIQWHNGSRGLTGIPFFHVSLTHIRPLDKACLLREPTNQNLPSSFLATTHDKLKKNKMLVYPDIEEMRKDDMGLYWILNGQGVMSAFIFGLYDLKNTPIGYLGVHFKEHRDFTKEEITYCNHLASKISGALSIHDFDRRRK